MATFSSRLRDAVNLHRRAVAHIKAAQGVLEEETEARMAADDLRQKQTLERLNSIVDRCAHGWWGAPWETLLDANPGDGQPDEAGPIPVRIGHTVGGSPAMIPLLNGGNIVVDEDIRDARVAGMVQGLLLRILAASPAGSVLVQVVDMATAGSTFAPFLPLKSVGLIDESPLDRALDRAEAHLRLVHEREFSEPRAEPPPILVLVVTGLAGNHYGAWPRLEAVAHAGPASRVFGIFTGVSAHGRWGDEPPGLEPSTAIEVNAGKVLISRFVNDEDPGEPLSIILDPAPSASMIINVSGRIAERLHESRAVSTPDLFPDIEWTESSVSGLATAIGRDGDGEVELALNDATAHWLIAGRTGSGKTVFLLAILYGLAARYSPAELSLYLLDFKEGVSFSEFTPSRDDNSWLPHVKAVGIESDRQYGIAVLKELQEEILRRSVEMKRARVNSLRALRELRPDAHLPRIVAVIDEYQVLFSQNDGLTNEAVGLLEEIARKGRSYGVHLILASQTSRGITAFINKDSIFAQFAMRIALPGGGDILDIYNDAADSLPLGSAVINDQGGVSGHNRIIRFPDTAADPSSLQDARQRMWSRRQQGAMPPAIFEGYAAQHVKSDAQFAAASETDRHRRALVGRVVDVAQSTAGFVLDTTPGRHVAILGPSAIGADILQAALLSVGRQHRPGTARFLVAGLTETADPAVDELVNDLTTSGHEVRALDVPAVVTELAALTEPSDMVTYLALFGADAASGALEVRDIARGRSGLDDFRAVLRTGPGRGIHVLGWWRSTRQFSSDIGVNGRDDVACAVVLNVPGSDIWTVFGQGTQDYVPRENRALLVDRHDGRVQLIVPFVRNTDGKDNLV